jgi:large subunit ribosomal protein L18
MADGPRYHVPRRRRREGRTDYDSRLALLKSGETRAVVRTQNRNTIVQFTDYDPEGDVIRAQATAQDLEAEGWDGHLGNLPAAYLTGLLAGARAREAGVDAAVLDIGLHDPNPGSAVFSALRGALDAGVEIPHDEGVLPEEERAVGAHISEETEDMTTDVKDEILEGSA